MGMGYGANYADVIEDKDVEALCPVAHRAFMVNLKANDMSLDQFAYNLSIEEGCGIDLEADYGRLCEEFHKKTGLELSLRYHSRDDGDRYDDIVDGFWVVEGMYELTKAGKKLANKVNRCYYVTFG